MKKNLTIIILIAILAGISYFAGSEIWRMRSDLKRLRSNQANILTGNQSAVKQLTRAEFKEIYGEVLDSMFRIHGLKSKNIEHYITTDYRVRDTLIRSELKIIDSSQIIKSFVIQRPCYEFSGLVLPDTIIANLDVQDRITTLLYWQRKQGWMGVRWFWNRREHKAIILSGCSGDTLQIQENVEVIKN